MNRYSFNLIGGTSLWVMAACCPAAAQSYSYQADFETATTHPAVKSYASADTILADSIRWVMPGVYLGNMTNTGDFKNGAHAARIRLTGNTAGAPGYLEMAEALPGAETITFYTAMYGTETGGKLLVYYRGSAGSWVAAGDTITVPSHDSPMLASRSISYNGDIRIRIQRTDTADTRIDVDDIIITPFGTGTHMLITGKMPAGTGIPITTDSLLIQFDHPVTAGQGSLTLQKSGGTGQTIGIPSGQVRIFDSTAVISGFTLEDASDYYVLMTDSAFTDNTGMLPALAITDTAYWTFSTEDTVSIPPLTSLQETFLACNAEQQLMGLFIPVSVTGGQVWECTSSGHADSFAVRISGGFGAGVSEENEDWLISRAPFDLSGMENPELRFWQKSRYQGAVVREVRISNSYTGSGAPYDTGVSWQVLNVQGIDEMPGDEWSMAGSVDLSAYKYTPFYLAFVYRCGTGGAYELSYDDISIAPPAGILPQYGSGLQCHVLGTAADGCIRLALNSPRAQSVKLAIFDLMGKRVYREAFSLQSGLTVRRISGLSLRAGMYIIRLRNGRGQSTVKVLVP